MEAFHNYCIEPLRLNRPLRGNIIDVVRPDKQFNGGAEVLSCRFFSRMKRRCWRATAPLQDATRVLLIELLAHMLDSHAQSLSRSLAASQASQAD